MIATIAGLIGTYLANNKDATTSQSRFVYSIVVAALSIFLSIIWLMPFGSSIVHYPTDLIMFLLWIIVYGLMVSFIAPLNCGSIWAWGDITQQGNCQKWKAATAFSFLSAVFWFVSALVVCYLALWVLKDIPLTRLGSVPGTCTQVKNGASDLLVHGVGVGLLLISLQTSFKTFLDSTASLIFVSALPEDNF